MDLQLKDWLTIGVAVLALMVAVTSFYYANIHKPADARLTLLARSHTPSVIDVKAAEHNYYVQTSKVISKAKTNLSYSLSNTGKQALCVKSVEVLRGPSRKGNLRDARGFLILSSTETSSFVIESGDIKIIEVSYECEDSSVDVVMDKYRLFSVELVSADGSRYQICHDITHVGDVASIHDPLWDGIALGGSVRSELYV